MTAMYADVDYDKQLQFDLAAIDSKDAELIQEDFVERSLDQAKKRALTREKLIRNEAINETTAKWSEKLVENSKKSRLETNARQAAIQERFDNERERIKSICNRDARWIASKRRSAV